MSGTSVIEMQALSKKVCKCGHLAENHFYWPPNDFATCTTAVKETQRRNARKQCMMQDPENPCSCQKYESKEED